jgi:hypothetical protein
MFMAPLELVVATAGGLVVVVEAVGADVTTVPTLVAVEFREMIVDVTRITVFVTVVV